MGAKLHSAADLHQVGVHRLPIRVGHHQPSGFALAGADGAEEKGIGCPLILGRYRTGSAPCPAAGDLVFLSNPRLVLPPEFDWDLTPYGAIRQFVSDFLDALGKFF